MEFPFINWIQTINVYETDNCLYLIGSDIGERRFRLLQIDRNPVPALSVENAGCFPTIEGESPVDRLWRLEILEDPKTHTKFEMANLLRTIQSSHRRLRFASNLTLSSTNSFAEYPSTTVHSESPSSELLSTLNAKSSTSFISRSGRIRSFFKLRRLKPAIPSPLILMSESCNVPLNPNEIQQDSSISLGCGNEEHSLRWVTRCHGLVGVVRFLCGYYLILITRCRQVAHLGEHKIYKVEETSMIYIPGKSTVNPSSGGTGSNGKAWTSNEEIVQETTPGLFQLLQNSMQRSRVLADETHYTKLFSSVDLSTNFYFSYTYDLSHNLQYNLEPVFTSGDCSDSKLVWAVRSLPDDRFVWNWRLLPLAFRPVSLQSANSGCSPTRLCSDQPDWFTLLFHGSVNQAALTACGMPVMITLIARRSRHFAGTRFLKRGTNDLGEVANEVESEQIVHDSSHAFLRTTKCSSYVQLRGSVPIFWSQEGSKVMVGRPPIEILREDPYYEAFGSHFADLFQRYGAPVVVMNLMKRRERRPFERVLSERLEHGLEYISQFLPSSIPIRGGAVNLKVVTDRSEGSGSYMESPPIIYVGFDVARVQKHKNLDVFDQLRPRVQACIRRTGLFLFTPKRTPRPMESDLPNLSRGSPRRQRGVIRVNCVDCLDRTNTTQFVIGRCVLGRQLHLLGFLTDPEVGVESRIEILLQTLYDEHGDALALQYAGSQLVHNIATYKKKRRLSSHSRDIMQTLSRYYSNKFSDWDKQCAINLFLRIYRPSIWPGTLYQLVCEQLVNLMQMRHPRKCEAPEEEHATPSGGLAGDNSDSLLAAAACSNIGPLWEFAVRGGGADGHLHWLDAWGRLPVYSRRPLTDWCPRHLLESLSDGGLHLVSKATLAKPLAVSLPCSDMRVNWLSEFYRPFAYQCLDVTCILSHVRWVTLPVQTMAEHRPHGSTVLPYSFSCNLVEAVAVKQHHSSTIPTGLSTPTDSWTVHSPRQSIRYSSSMSDFRSAAQTVDNRPQASEEHQFADSHRSGVKQGTKNVNIADNTDENGVVLPGTTDALTVNEEDSSSESDFSASTEDYLKVFPPSFDLFDPVCEQQAVKTIDNCTNVLAGYPIGAIGSRCVRADAKTVFPFTDYPTREHVKSCYEDYLCHFRLTTRTVASPGLSPGPPYYGPPNASAMAAYRIYVSIGESGDCPIPTPSMQIYHATVTMAYALRC